MRDEGVERLVRKIFEGRIFFLEKLQPAGGDDAVPAGGVEIAVPVQIRQHARAAAGNRRGEFAQAFLHFRGKVLAGGCGEEVLDGVRRERGAQPRGDVFRAAEKIAPAGFHQLLEHLLPVAVRSRGRVDFRESAVVDLLIIRVDEVRGVFQEIRIRGRLRNAEIAADRHGRSRFADQRGDLPGPAERSGRSRLHQQSRGPAGGRSLVHGDAAREHDETPAEKFAVQVARHALRVRAELHQVAAAGKAAGVGDVRIRLRQHELRAAADRHRRGVRRAAEVLHELRSAVNVERGIAALARGRSAVAEQLNAAGVGENACVGVPAGFAENQRDALGHGNRAVEKRLRVRDLQRGRPAVQPWPVSAVIVFRQGIRIFENGVRLFLEVIDQRIASRKQQRRVAGKRGDLSGERSRVADQQIQRARSRNFHFAVGKRIAGRDPVAFFNAQMPQRSVALIKELSLAGFDHEPAPCRIERAGEPPVAPVALIDRQHRPVLNQDGGAAAVGVRHAAVRISP